METRTDRINRLASSYHSDTALLAAIESITGGDLDTCADPACRCCISGEDCTDPALALWVCGGREDEIAAELDRTTPGWRAEGLWWGEELFRG